MRAVILVVLLAGCGAEATMAADAGRDALACTPPAGRKLDLLVMADNSSSTLEARDFFSSYLPTFLAGLEAGGRGLDLHLGVVSSDMGAGVFQWSTCTPGGDRGILHNAPDTADECGRSQLRDPGDRFITYVVDPSGATESNVTGSVADAFACYARALGTGGCRFEHQLASVQAALDGCNTDGGCSQPANAGFLRPDAQLAIILLTDEDDCSARPDSTLFDPSQTTVDSALGPLTGYRCFEFGILCNGEDPGRYPGPRTACIPGSKDPDPKHQLIPVREVADALKALKQDPRFVYVAAIGCPAVPIVVGVDPNTGWPDLQPSCRGAIGTANPDIRVSAFANQFDRGRFVSEGSQDLAAAMNAVAAEIAAMVDDPCAP